MSSQGSPPIDEEDLKRYIQDALKDGLAGLDDGFGGLGSDVGTSLNKKTPNAGIAEFLDDVARENSQGTYDTVKSRMSFFEDWCSHEDDDGSPRIQYLHELDGQDIKDFRDWRREESGWKTITEESQMKTLRKFLKFAEKPEWVAENLYKKVPIPNVDPENESRDTIIRQAQVDDILSYLERFEYATLAHCEWAVIGKTGCRLSGFRALDLDDYAPDDETGKAILKFRNRPETGTRLKNGDNSERNVEVSEEVRTIIDDYIEHNRHDVTDDYGRKPLFTSKFGRPGDSTIRKYAYMWSRPCASTGECPFNRDIAECEAAQSNDQATKCPDSVSTHPIRRGRLTWQLNEGMLPQMIAELYDVSPDVLKKHYDERSHAEKQRLASMWRDIFAEFIMDDIRDSTDR